MKTIYCKGKHWTLDEYNKRVSAENLADERYDKVIAEIDAKLKKEIDEIWMVEE